MSYEVIELIEIYIGSVRRDAGTDAAAAAVDVDDARNWPMRRQQNGLGNVILQMRLA